MPGQARVLKPEDIRNVLQMLRSERDRLLFQVGIYTGLRVSEIISLRTVQFWTEQGHIRQQLTVQRAKKRGPVYSSIPLHPKLRAALKSSGRPDSDWLFPSALSRSGHLGRTAAHNILKDAFDRLKLDGASTHSMRRTALTQMSRAGIPLRTIQQISGHSSLKDLQVYLDSDPDDVERAIKALRY